MLIVDDWQAYRAMVKLIKQYESNGLDMTWMLLNSIEEAGERVAADPGTYGDWMVCLLDVLREDAGLPPPGVPRGTQYP